MNINTYVVGGDNSYTAWIPDCKIVTDMKRADLVFFTGGEDVDPSYYKEKRNETTYSNPSRDRREKIEFGEAVLLKKPLLGVCRGSQFLCVMAGGKLVQNQHQPNPHPIFLPSGAIITVGSYHHQAQFPWNLPPNEFEVLGWSVGLSGLHEGAPGVEMEHGGMEVEIAYYRKINALAIQSHPEWADQKGREVQNAQELLVKMLKGNLCG